MEAWMQQDSQTEIMETFEKQTFRNRCLICDMQGRVIRLSVPVCKVESKQLTRDIMINQQQRWQHQHWEAMKSAYKHTPYYDYYADYFRPWYEKPTRWLIDLNEGLAAVVSLLINNVFPQAGTTQELHARTNDWSQQTWTDSHPWQNELSIVDTLFRLGPETKMAIRNRKVLTK